MLEAKLQPRQFPTNISFWAIFWSAVLRGFETPHGSQQARLILLAPQQDRNKPV